MEFLADLHVHSRFSLATSRALDPVALAMGAASKGLRVIGTGDFTHPVWRAELREKLVFDEESGLYRLNPALAVAGADVLFCPQAEISCVYKKGGKTRKVHNVLFAPNLDVTDKIAQSLARIGSINSDGRPVLKLDSRDLLEIALEISSDVVLVPAHIWTPWFSLFGAKSGFDAIEECFEDLTPHIFALEMGLSSDPSMNRRVSALDKYALIANSDAHSAANLGREANIFEGKPGYANIFSAIKAAATRAGSGNGACLFKGTLGFYPEAGKYHLDGHRACGVCLEPAESVKLGDACPECGKPLTLGALHRVMELADRDKPFYAPGEPSFMALAPLAEILARVSEVSPGSRAVQRKYEDTLRALGPELYVTRSAPIEQIRRFDPVLAEAIVRTRSGRVRLIPGFDGRFGEIEIFTPKEMESIRKNRDNK